MKTTPTLYLAEYQAFSETDIAECLKEHRAKAPRIWEALLDFAHQEGNHTFLRFKNKRTLKTQNYVGLIQVQGFCIEILPKICGHDLDKDHVPGCPKQIPKLDRSKFQDQVKKFVKSQDSLEPPHKPDCPLCHAKAVLYNCLITLKDAPFKQSQFSQLHSAHLPLLDIFVQMFLDACAQLIKRGLKRDYLAISENRHYLKGKLEFANHLKYNLIHKERFYTTSDEYSLDNPPNRLIRSTLEMLKTLSLSPKSQEKLNSVRFVFDEVRVSTHIERDFAKSAHASRFKEYEHLLAWCDLFLRKKSLTPYSGTSRAYALLFPMEKLFESFVGHWLKKSLEGYSVGLQKQNRKYLMLDQQNRRCFEMFPDIVLENDTEITILDTKWKLLKVQKDISHADLYQMWAYASKYALPQQDRPTRQVQVWLVYPHQETEAIQPLTFKASELFKLGDIALSVRFFPLHIKGD
ncbi:McrC family protein [Helicobacter felis]|uniref:McrBC 5-methylcytosine restriction system component n=1 Tax=Helicobacter felis (strain ATCC 49179 / CCUG 28539 / NCTC 12436 / CS1) TaxID=936155 RepID=E7AB33_HELFC|nr:McrC family protein [Helicobacter felis]CBY82793.1 McrBC 5-methylcytosine restriction system component [Helicobacter felis ATCC 49179]